ncbi:MAG: flagellar assembly protein FliW [Armatimonadota bacterium]
MIIETTRFGQIEVDGKSLIHLQRGIIGYEDAAEFCILREHPDSVFNWLQCTTRPGLAFMVVDPWEVAPDYHIELSPVEADYLDAYNSEDILALTVVDAGSNDCEVTINFACPIIINSKSMTGLQVVLDAERQNTGQPKPRKSTTGAAKHAAKAA